MLTRNVRWYLRRTAIVLSLLLAFANVTVRAQTPRARIESAIAATRAAAVEEQKANPSWKDFGTELSAALDRAQSAAEADRLYLSVEELGRARTFLTANHFAARAAKEGREGFQKAWEQAYAQLDKVRIVSSKDVPPVSAAILALVESARFRSPTLVMAAKAYAEVTNAEAGFYYLGQAGADAEFASSATSFGLRAPGKRLRIRAIGKEIAELQARVNEAFRPPRSIDKHPAFIRLNSSLKSATELNNAGSYHGALYHYLDAVQQYSVLMGGDNPAREVEPLRSEIAEAAVRLAKLQEDASLAVLFMERGQALLSASQPDEQARRRAAAIVRDVLPAYEMALKPASQPTTEVARVIDVTLVRWPYT